MVKPNETDLEEEELILQLIGTVGINNFILLWLYSTELDVIGHRSQKVSSIHLSIAA